MLREYIGKQSYDGAEKAIVESDHQSPPSTCISGRESESSLARMGKMTIITTNIANMALTKPLDTVLHSYLFTAMYGEMNTTIS